MIAPWGYLLSTCMFIGSSLGSSVGDVFRRTEDILREQTIRCNQHCPYGFETDIEGFFTCTCLKPCANLLCFPGYKCVVDIPKHCDWPPCKPVATCKEDTKVITYQKTKTDRSPHPEKPGFPLQQDEPWWALGTNDDLCSLPLAETAVSCRRKRRRWYYSSMTGKCVRFMGCDTDGNNFSRKRYCKATCRNKRREFRLRQRKNLRKQTPR